MKRVADSRRHPTMLGDEAVKGGDNLRVAQNNGDLAAFCAQGGLPLRAGLGLGHGSDGDVAKAARLFSRDADAVAGGVAVGLKNSGVCRHMSQAGDLREVGANAGRDVAKQSLDSRKGWNLLWEVAGAGEGLHFVSPLRANPADEPSSHVTSDKSRPFVGKPHDFPQCHRRPDRGGSDRGIHGLPAMIPNPIDAQIQEAA
jgi:hypothetical protein